MDLVTDHKLSDNRQDLGTATTRSGFGILDCHTSFEIQDSEASDVDLVDNLEDEPCEDHTEVHNSHRTVDTVLIPGGLQATTQRLKKFVSEWNFSILQPIVNTAWQYYEDSRGT